MGGFPKSALYTSVALVGLGFVFMFLAWNGAAGKDYVQGQVPYLISGGLIGMALVASGLAVIIVQALRREGAETRMKLDELIDTIRDQEEAATPAPTRRRRAS